MKNDTAKKRQNLEADSSVQISEYRVARRVMKGFPRIAPGTVTEDWKRDASAAAMISLIWGTLVTRMRSTRASATRRTPQRAKGDWGREKVGAASCFYHGDC